MPNKRADRKKLRQMTARIRQERYELNKLQFPAHTEEVHDGS